MTASKGVVKVEYIKQDKIHSQEYDLNKNHKLVEEFLMRICDGEATKHVLASDPIVRENKGKKFFNLTTFYKLMLRHPAFKEAYYEAKSVGAEMEADNMKQLADNADANSLAAISKAKLQIETRKFIAMSLLPKRYGSQVKIDKTIKDERVVDSDQIKEIVKKIRSDFNKTSA